jgi:hypothetical protein
VGLRSQSTDQPSTLSGDAFPHLDLPGAIWKNVFASRNVIVCRETRVTSIYLVSGLRAWQDDEGCGICSGFGMRQAHRLKGWEERDPKCAG